MAEYDRDIKRNSNLIISETVTNKKIVFFKFIC